MNKLILSTSVFLSAAGLFAATIDNVFVRQNWPWSSEVEVSYVISGVTEPVDLVVSFSNGATPLAADTTGGRLAGDVIAVAVGGEKRFTFDPKAVFGAAMPNSLKDLRVRIDTVKTTHPDYAEVIYKVVNLDANPMTVTDLTRGDILSGRYGAYETDFGKVGPGFTTSLSDVLVWTGVTNGDLYKTSKLVLRKIPSAGQSYKMGPASASLDVSFTNDFWIGVFELTQAQVKMISPSFDYWYTNQTCWATRAAYVSWGSVRGNNADYLTTCWPHGNHTTVGKSSILGKLQAATGIDRFDLPTEAQWEYAARGGNFGNIMPSGKVRNATNMKELGPRAANNGGDDGTACKFSPKNDPNGGTDGRNCSIEYGNDAVGRAAPNAYGLYDVLNNAFEWMLNRAARGAGNDGRNGVEPRGTASNNDLDGGGNTGHYIRGGSWAYAFDDVGAAWTRVDWYANHYLGARLCLHEENVNVE